MRTMSGVMIIMYIVLAFGLGMALGHVVGRRNTEKVYQDMIRAIKTRGKLAYATPTLLGYAVRRSGSWLPRSIVTSLEEGEEEE